MFKRIIFALFLSLMLLFFVWTVIGFQQYGADLTSKHLNFYAMFVRFRNDFEAIQGYNFLDVIDEIKGLTNNFSNISILNWFEHTLASALNFNLDSNNDLMKLLTSFFNALFDPIVSFLYVCSLIVYLLGSIVMLLKSILFAMSCIINFIFFPLFI